MRIETFFNEQGDKILKIYNDELLVVDQVTKANPDCDIPMPPKKELTIQAANSQFYLPNHEEDLIQKLVLSNKDYFERRELDIVSTYLNKNSVVVDIGANIGNHTLYFANECKVKKIYSFEPVPYTYEILKKNVEINHLEDRVIPLCIGMYNKSSRGVIRAYDLKNLGGTNLKASENGEIELATLDSIKIKEKIDFIKIDVEGMDYETLLGARKTIKRDKPIIMLESFENEQKKTFPLLEKYGYEKTQDLGNFEYIFTPKQTIETTI